MNDVATVSYSKHLIFSNKHGGVGSATDFQVNFQNTDFTNHSIVRILPLDILIPNMFENVVTGQNDTSVWDDGGGPYVVTMPPGHYTVDEWVAEFTLQLATTGSPVAVTGHSIDPVTNILTISFDAAFSYLGAHDLTNTNTLLGSDNVTIASVANDIVFAYPPQFQGPSLVLIETDMTQSNATLGQNNQQMTILDAVSMTETCYGSTKHHRILTDNARAISFPGSPNMKNFTIRLVDIDKRPLSMPKNVEVIFHILLSYSAIA
jgi:hypothetical protein